MSGDTELTPYTLVQPLLCIAYSLLCIAQIGLCSVYVYTQLIEKEIDWTMHSAYSIGYADIHTG
jgi:hypothetical protein